jgi:predicted PolB exonuclease-like 3'-5' exonuclease
MNILVFDIETVPDVETARRLYDINGLSDQEVANVMHSKRMQETEGRTDFIRQHLQRVVAISAVLRTPERLSVWSVGDPNSPEGELIQRFFDGVERYNPTLVSWNGRGFDLPVLHYRALYHGVSAPRYWETGDGDSSFRWNNYLNRFHARHTDLMDVLAGYETRAYAPLQEIATLLGLPGKLGMSGADVWDRFMAEDIAAIRNYCETDVLNTYLVYLRFELMRGHLTASGYEAARGALRGLLENEDKPHFHEFLAAWPS